MFSFKTTKSRPMLLTFAILCLATLNVSGQAPKPDDIPGDANYILAPDDLIQVKVFQEDDLLSNLRISKDNTITFPLIGSVKIGGRSPQDAARIIQDALAKDYLVNPQVNVTVIQYSKRHYTVLGQVQKPGSYDIPDREQITLLQAIGTAGGYTRIADPAKITLKRSIDGRESVIKLNAKRMANENGSAFGILPGDVITVGESIF
jgi:polysaccharide export outer membrane protein